MSLKAIGVMKRPNRLQLSILKFLKHKIYIPIRRLEQNIGFTILYNYLINLFRRRGFSPVQINWNLKSTFEICGIVYNGEPVIIAQPLFSVPHNQFDDKGTASFVWLFYAICFHLELIKIVCIEFIETIKRSFDGTE